MTDNPSIATPPIEPVKTPPQAKLEDLETATITMVITLADDSEVTLPLRMIPQFRMMQLVANIPNPQPPLVDYGKGGVPIFNEKDPTFLANYEQAAFTRNSILIAEMVMIDIPGDTLEAKAEYIREKFDPLVTEQVILALKMQQQKAKARIVTRAATFQR